MPYLDALTSCVGPVYASYLKKSLPVWLDELDSLTVVTKLGDYDTLKACEPHKRVRVVETGIFNAYGAHFNKGAALTIGYADMDPVDLVLHFDSDIMPSPGWRKLAESELREGAIAGAVRCEENGRPITDLGPWPYGYFQLWSSHDPKAMHWPIFEPWHPHCGSYDLEFLERWPSSAWQKLSFKVTHFGEVRKNWFGVGLEEEAQRKSFDLMDRVHQVGLRETRMRARQGHNRLKVPDFRKKYSFSRRDYSWARDMVRACMTSDPFLVRAVVEGHKPGFERVKLRQKSPENIREEVGSLLR